MWSIQIYRWKFGIMSRKEVLTSLLIVQWTQRFFIASRHHLLCSLSSNAPFLANVSHCEDKESKTVITCNALALQDLFVWKQYRFSGLCSSLIPFIYCCLRHYSCCCIIHLTPVDMDFQRLSQRSFSCFVHGSHKHSSYQRCAGNRER